MQRERFATRTLATVACAALLVGCSGSRGEINLQGSGATFPAPIYKRWFLDYYGQHSDTRINYSPIGSGAGIRQFTSGLVNFGASDAGMSKKEIDKLPPDYGGVLLLPMTAGCIALSYNLPGLSQPVRLSRSAYVRIFLRQITSWRDPEIADKNPGVPLPEEKITVVTRADSSGTTYAFTTHMDAVAKDIGIAWEPGVDKSVRWKESIAAQGNDGVAALIQLTPGAIGYIEYGYAELAGLPMAAVENRAHEFVAPDAEGNAGRRALEGAAIPADLQIKVPDSQADGAYPIVTYTWLLFRKVYDSAQTADTLKSFLRFAAADDQQRTAQELGYLRLPNDVVTRLRSEIETIHGKE
jgi:phosphate transport system substrate-binding protein